VKIFVFDDSRNNQWSARVQLKDHDLTIVGTFDEASDLLAPLDGGKPNPKFQKFDVVLTDLMVLASERQLGPNGRDYIGKEMPLGSIIALQALSVGVKKVALVTDANHHDHPASAALDPFRWNIENPSHIGDAVLYCTNYWVTADFHAGTGELLGDMHGVASEDVVKAKDWAKALQTLLK